MIVFKFTVSGQLAHNTPMRWIDSNFRCVPEGDRQNVELNHGIFWRQVQLSAATVSSGANTCIAIVK
jgi:hypothetical protein